MATTVDRWRVFWADKTTPLYPQDTSECYRAHAQELKLLFGTQVPSRVLEIGCGNGALYSFLGFDENCVAYRGVDLSESMLAIFKQNYPKVEVYCADGSAYVDRGSQFDLIFSNQVVQCFDPDMLEKHLANARAMMHSGSRLVCASIPWKTHRRRYHAGAFLGDMDGSDVRLAKSYLSRAVKGDRIGCWYEPHDIAKRAAKHGLSVRFHGSFLFLYRFHAVLQLAEK